MAAKVEDRTLAYAKAVHSGKIIAGPYVRGECARHIEDRKNGKKRGLIFDVNEAADAISFFEEILTVEADDEVVPFNLIDWQAFIIGSLFGWYMADGSRRFRTSYVETGKGSGKSPLAAGVGIYGMVADGVASAEVYSSATMKSQSMILFRDATAMIERSPELRKRLTPSGGNPVWQWTHIESRSMFKPLSKEEAVSGPRPSIGLIDEYHEHKTADAAEMIEAGFKFRQNPLLFVITNSGSSKITPCGTLHDFACSVAIGAFDDTDLEAADRVFTYICAIDEGDDPLKDEACWPKANPSLGITIKHEYLRAQVASARAMPAKQNKVLRLNFCVWTDAPDAWVTRLAWEACESKRVTWEAMVGRQCFGGLDLSYTTDMSALALVFPKQQKLQTIYEALVVFWRPKEGLQEACDKDKVKYDIWAKDGDIELTSPGRVIKLPPIASMMAKAQNDFDLQVIAYDQYRHKELADDVYDMGLELPMQEHPQGFRRAKVTDPVTLKVEDNPLWMPGSCLALETAIIEKRLRVAVNPALRWNVSSCVIREDPAGTDNYIFDKRKATGRIDGLAALAMAIGAAKAGHVRRAPKSPWEDESFSLSR